MMSVGQIPIISYYILGFIGGLYLLPHVDTTARFTHFPPSVLYVSSGGTARFVWDYHVDDRGQEFQPNSPVWSLIDKRGNGMEIGSDDKYTNNWSFVINRATCPPRLLNPDRVSRESVATLVITNVTTADNGIYRCSLVLKAGNPIEHQVQLFVTVTPKFQPQPPQTKNIAEGQDLSVPCTAVGPPIPNITWVQIVGHVTKITGTGSATLRIPNIRRDQNGTYECQASNNPNENVVTAQIMVVVYYLPGIDTSESSMTLKSWNGYSIRLRCLATGLPAPRISWYKPTNQQITTGVNIVPGGSEVTVLTTADQGDYGQYKCRATNILGSDEHVINVTRLFPPGPLFIAITELEASSITIRWTTPADDGGLVVTDYLLEVSTKPPVITVNTHAVITRLKANTLYTVKVCARNIVGYGVVSSKVIRTKTIGKPSIPHLISTILNGKDSKLSVVLRWTKPDDNGGNITRYTIYMREVKHKAEWTKYDNVTDSKQLEYKITRDIVYGKTYMFMVTAWNKYGESVKDDGSTKTVNTTADEATAANAMSYCTEEGSKYSSTAMGVVIGILVLFLVFNLLLIVYLRRRAQLSSKKESQAHNNRQTQKKAVAGESYHNDLELEEKVTSAVTTSRSPQAVQTGPEYETIHQSNPNEAGSSSDTSNYQGLNLMPNASIQGAQGPVYEPLGTRSSKPNLQRKDNEQHQYEALNIGNQDSAYQSLQTNSRELAI